MKQRADPIYGQTGGCCVGRNSWLAQHWTWPVTGLYIYRDELVLSMSFRGYCFPRDQILDIHRCPSRLWIGLKIEHSVSNFPPFIVFWPKDVLEMEEALDRNAFQVAPHSPK
jgi:hypothetical protein